MAASALRSGNNWTNSNNVELLPLKQEDNTGTTVNRRFTDASRMSRNANSPLPAVPLPQKLSKANSRTAHVSCDDLLQLTPARSNGTPAQPHLVRAASFDLDMFGRSTSATQPLLMEPPIFGASPQSGNTTLRSGHKYTQIHDYEEFSEDQRRNQVRISQNLLASDDPLPVRYQPMASPPISNVPQSPPLPTTSHPAAESNRQYPRERQNPMYSGVRVISPFTNPTSDHPKQTKSNVMTEKCACAIVTGLIVAILISFISIIIVTLLGVGIISPANASSSGGGESEKDFRELQTTIMQLKRNEQLQADETKKMLNQLNESINELQTELNAVATNKSDVRIAEIRQQLRSAIQSLNPDEVQNIFGSLSGSALSRCRHDAFAIGASASLDIVYSGKFYAEKGFSITGATCSSPPGYVASLGAEATDENKTMYECKCVKISRSQAPSSGRVECEIHYWECPLSPA